MSIVNKFCALPVGATDKELSGVHELYRAHSATLGFLPRGAFQEMAQAQRLLSVHDGEILVGYLAYRVSGMEAVIVHLCVRENHRGAGVAKALMEQLFVDTSALECIRLSCREDYTAANRLWARFGFICAGERVGRGQARNRILLWRRQVQNQLLLDGMQLAHRRNRWTVVLDANVFYDFDSAPEQEPESKSLLADWLVPDVLLCVTAELKNEISRDSNEERRTRHRNQLLAFELLEATGAELSLACNQINSVLPPPVTASDESDRRQIGHASAKQADFFITRDQELLDHADALRQLSKIEVMRPSEFIIRLHTENSPRSYIPARLVGTKFTQSTPKSETELAPFQKFSQAESKVFWLERCRVVLINPERYHTKIIKDTDGHARILYTLETEEPNKLNLLVLRWLSHPLTATLLRRVLSEVILRAQREGRDEIWYRDTKDPLVEEALKELGFIGTNQGFMKASLHGVMKLDALLQVVAVSPLLSGANVQGATPEEMERQLWPLKLEDAGIESFIVPIRPHFAAQLFDAELADQDLFGADHKLALALENVYYSASAINIKPGSRILWYVSGKGNKRVGQIRACSLCTETVQESAKQLYRRFSRLGIYSWKDILQAAKGNIHGGLSAYRFAFTERFRHPVAWERIQTILQQYTERSNPLAGPTKIANDVFIDIYKEGTA